MTDGNRAGMFPPFSTNSAFVMIRQLLGICCIALISGLAVAEVPSALPVDPSEITPESGLSLVDPAPPVNEAKPLAPGEVVLPEVKKNPRSDTPDVNDLPTGADAVRLQIFLDQEHFGPGVIDGKPGRFTILAVDSWNEVNGHPSGEMGPVMKAARAAVPNPFATILKTWKKLSRNERAKPTTRE